MELRLKPDARRAPRDRLSHAVQRPRHGRDRGHIDEVRHQKRATERWPALLLEPHHEGLRFGQFRTGVDVRALEA